MLKTRATPAPRRPAGALRVAIIAARYNAPLVDALLRHTTRTLAAAGARRVVTWRVPGSYEIPALAMKLARSRRHDAIIALGVVLQGKTAHADHIGMACAINLQRVAMETGVPVIHQVLSPRNERDARARLKIRGVEAARAAIEMAATMRNG